VIPVFDCAFQFLSDLLLPLLQLVFLVFEIHLFGVVLLLLEVHFGLVETGHFGNGLLEFCVLQLQRSIIFSLHLFSLAGTMDLFQFFAFLVVL
jgi:hypothetical protein